MLPQAQASISSSTAWLPSLPLLHPFELPRCRTDRRCLSPPFLDSPHQAYGRAGGSGRLAGRGAVLEAGAQPSSESHRPLLCRHGWRVRRLRSDDTEALKLVANIQACAFHERSIALDGLLFSIFKAGILGNLLYRMQHALPNRYACLVAESDSRDSSEIKMVGAVDVTALAEKNVLRNLPGAEEYLYVSGIAVSHMYRRQKVATTLLQACDLTAVQWGFRFLVLQAYENDFAAMNLYSKVGYKVISKDPPWLSTWLGRRQRVLLAKLSAVDFQDN